MKKVFIVVIFLLSFAYASGSELQIYFLDVGQGDATCIIGENGKTLLIDAGNNGKGDSVIVPFLRFSRHYTFRLYHSNTLSC